jgi:oligopeptidase B
MRPDLFRAIIMSVPFLDPMTTMLDPEIPLTKVEYLEWGNPAESEQMYDYMASYAPYDTIPDFFNSNNNKGGKKMSQATKGGETKDADGSALTRTTEFPKPPLSARRPALMISCGERDQRVDYSQSTKFVARLRSRLAPWYGSEGKEACVLMIDENRGHFGNGTQEDRVKNWAREVVFLLGSVQMEGSGPNVSSVGDDTRGQEQKTRGESKL